MQVSITFALVKRILAIFLMFAMLSQALVNVGIGVYYHLNKEYISQKLCENRNKPELHCNGHCYLSKQLKKAEEGQNRSQSQTVKGAEDVLIDHAWETSPDYIPAFSVTGLLPAYKSYLPQSPLAEIVLPPKIAA